MNIIFKPTSDLARSAEFTASNMAVYYKHYTVDWDLAQIVEQITDLDNWDIIYDEDVVGALRLSLTDTECYLRDLQVAEHCQNKGIGAKALLKCEALVKDFGATEVKLRVFKISPAYHLYLRHGYQVESDDDRFYYMVKKSFNKYVMTNIGKVFICKVNE